VFGPSGPTLSSSQLDRFEEDRRVLAKTLPRVRHLVLADGGGAIAQGPVDVDLGAGCFEPVEIRMEFGPRYPPQPPTVFDHGHRWRPALDRHLLNDHRFCLWLAGVDTPSLPTSEHLRTFALQILVFLRDQFVFDDLGRWPNRDWPHGPVAAYGQHVVERLGMITPAAFDELWRLVLGASTRADRACPCGSRMPYGRCHREAVRELVLIGRRDDQSEIAAAARSVLV
jgi:hypothetical protein